MARRKRKRKPYATQSRPAAVPDHGPRPDRWRPWLLAALAALVVARPLFPSESAASHGDGLLMVMLWIVLAVLWLVRMIRRRQSGIRFGWTDAAVLLLVGLHTVAALWAIRRASPRPAINMLWEWIGYGLCFLLARQLIVTRREARAVVAVMVSLAVAIAGYALYQYFYEMPNTRAAYERDEEKELRKAGIWYEPGSRERELFKMRVTESREPNATFALANSLAGYLAPWLVVTAGISVSSLAKRRIGLLRFLADCCSAVLIGGCILFALVLTKSRSGWLASLLGVLLVGAWLARLVYRKRRRRTGWQFPFVAAVSGATVVVVVAVVVVVVAAGGLDAKVFSEASKSFGYRIQYWQSTLQMIGDHPIAGCGPGNFQETYTRYALAEASEEIAEPHNFLMEVWATAGTPAMLALLGVLGCFALSLIRPPGFAPHDGSVADDQVPKGEIDGALHVLGGAAFGFLLSVPVGQISYAPPPVVGLAPGVWAPAAVLVGLPLAAATVLLLWRWISDGSLPPALLAIGAVVLLVNLLAAGAMGFPAVAGTLWLLVALGLNTVDRPGRHVASRAGVWAALAVVVVLAVACHASAYSPVLRCQTKMELARRELTKPDPTQRDPARAAEHLRAAVAADPLAADARRELGLLAFDRWFVHRTPDAFDEFETCMKTALDLAPRSAATWRMAGYRYRLAFVATGHEDTIRKAIHAYRKAVDLYPNDASTTAGLAMALRLHGEAAESARQAARALWLDQVTPHADKKLDDPVRDELRRGLPRSSRRED